MTMTRYTPDERDPRGEPAPEPVPATARAAARLQAMIGEEKRAAAAVPTTPLKGPGGQKMTLTDAEGKAAELDNRIDLDVSRGSERYRTVAGSVKALTLLFLVVIDFPIMLWLTSSVFNVDWADPFGLPLAISIVISILGTAGATSALYHLGHNRRENKNDRRQLEWSTLSGGAKVSLIGAGMLVALIGVVMFVRVYTEGVLSGLDGLALLLAVLVSLVMLLSASLVFFTAFRDGSPEQDDLVHYTTEIEACRKRQRYHEDRAARLRDELNMLLGRTDLDHTVNQSRPPTTSTSTSTAIGASSHRAMTNGQVINRAVHADDAADNGTPTPRTTIGNTRRPLIRPGQNRPNRFAPRPPGLRRPLS